MVRPRRLTNNGLVSGFIRYLALIVVAISLSACDGDPRPLTEAVEANDLDLASIEIQPPAGSLSPLFLSPGESLQFGILGQTIGGGSVVLSPADRRWVSTNESVVTVSDDGLVVGRSNGSASIGVRVAGSVAAAFDVSVSDAPLQSLESISGNNGVDTLSSCLPASFSVEGNFGGVDSRAISGVVWSVDADSQLVGAEIFEGTSTPAGGISLVGRQPTGGTVGEIVLTATLPADEETGQQELSISRRFDVSDTLTSLSVSPEEVTIEVGTSARLVASATYSDRNGAIFVTTGAEWMVTLSPGVASVGTVSDNPGVVTGIDNGVAEITAVCGDVTATSDVTVEDNRGSLSFDTNGLSFDTDGSVLLNLLDGQFDELRVSTGDEFDANREVTNEADWVSSDTSVVTVDNIGDDRGTLTLLTEGTSTISAEFEGTVITIDVTVDNLGIGN